MKRANQIKVTNPLSCLVQSPILNLWVLVKISTHMIPSYLIPQKGELHVSTPPSRSQDTYPLLALSFSKIVLCLAIKYDQKGCAGGTFRVFSEKHSVSLCLSFL